MKKMSIVYGICLAVVFTLATPIALTMLQILFSYNFLRVFVAVGIIAYTAAITPRSIRNSGRVFTFIACCAAVMLIEATVQGFGRFLLCNLAILWCVRALLMGRGILHVAADGALIAAAFMASIVAGTATHSISFAVWSFLLVLAAAPLMTAYCVTRKPDAERSALAGPTFRFERAHQSAEQALAALARTGR